MQPLSRIALRLADLSHAQLLEIAAAGCEASTEVRNRADAILAAHKPLAQCGSGRSRGCCSRVLAVGERLEGNQRGPASLETDGVRLPSGPAR
jgi:hypothetical protein